MMVMYNQLLGAHIENVIAAVHACWHWPHNGRMVSIGQTLTGMRDGIPVRRPDSQSREPGFKSHCGRFEPLACLITVATVHSAV